MLKLDKKFLSSLLKLALPIALASFLSALLNVVDSFMVSTLDETAMAAVVLVNSVVFLFQIMIFVLSSTATIFVAQYMGKGEKHNVPQAVGFALIVAVIVAILFNILSIFASKNILLIFSDDLVLIERASSYFIYVGFSSIPFAIATVISTTMRGVGEVKTPVIVTGLSVLFNAFFNYVFMFGKLGAPVMGLEGAGLGTLIARLLELIIILSIGFYKKLPTMQFSKMWHISRDFVNRYIKILFPAFINEFLWSLATTTYLVALGKLSNATVVIASFNVVMALDRLITVFMMGIGNGAGIVVGKMLGDNNKKEAIIFAKKSVLLALIIGLMLGVLMAVASFVIPSMYNNLSAEVLDLIVKISCIYAAFMAIRSINFTLIVGIFRAGGDAVFCAIVDLSAVWLIAVPMAFLGALVWQLDAVTIVFLILVEEIAKCAAVLLRLKSEKWARCLV